MKKLFIKPAEKGLKIPNPKTGKFLKQDGENVDNIKYWIRLLVRGEVVKAEAKQEKKLFSKKKKKEEIKTEKGE